MLHCALREAGRHISANSWRCEQTAPIAAARRARVRASARACERARELVRVRLMGGGAAWRRAPGGEAGKQAGGRRGRQLITEPMGCGQNGVSTNGAAAKVMDFDRLGQKGTLWHFWEVKSRLTGVPNKSL